MNEGNSSLKIAEDLKCNEQSGEGGLDDQMLPSTESKRKGRYRVTDIKGQKNRRERLRDSGP